jgi:hypothetical protein
MLIAALVAGLAGCSEAESNRLATVPVSGSVSFNGKPAAGAMVVLHPKNAAPQALPARGFAGPDGSFALTTYEATDGAVPGEYAVTVTLYQPVRQGDSIQPGPNVLPPRYADPTTTDLTVRVAEGAARLPALELKR